MGPAKKKKQVLPMRLAYVDTVVLIERLNAAYKDEENYELMLANDKLIVFAVRKLTKDEVEGLMVDRAVYTPPGYD